MKVEVFRNTVKRRGKGASFEMIKARDDRIAVLEHQLRCAKTDLTDSRTRLGSLQEEHLLSNAVKEMEIAENEVRDEKDNGGTFSRATSIERGALNCIVKQYLTNSGYKLTSLTFTEEEQSQELEMRRQRKERERLADEKRAEDFASNSQRLKAKAEREAQMLQKGKEEAARLKAVRDEQMERERKIVAEQKRREAEAAQKKAEEEEVKEKKRKRRKKNMGEEEKGRRKREGIYLRRV